MQKMTNQELESTTGGALSGSFLTGIGNIINGITDFIGAVAGLNFIFSGMDQEHTEGTFKFSKNLSFSWDDSHEKTQNELEVDFNHD